MTETITLPLSILTPEVRTALLNGAKAAFDKKKDADNAYKAKLREISDKSEVTGDVAATRLQEKHADIFNNYVDHHYHKKVVGYLSSTIDPNTMPKITLPVELLTPDIRKKIKAELDRIKTDEETAKHPYHEQASERLAALK